VALNKAEKQLIEDLKTAIKDLKTESALRRTEEVLPDVMPPELFKELSTGYVFVGPRSDTARVEAACSSSQSHGIGRTDYTSSQQSQMLYSTRLLALKGLRHEVENDCARRLRKVDVMIEKEMELEQES